MPFRNPSIGGRFDVSKVKEMTAGERILGLKPSYGNVFAD